MSLRVLVVDDQGIVRTGFVAVIDAEEDMTVVGEAADGAAAVQLAEELAPDVVVMDVRMPELDGIAATRIIYMGRDEEVLTTPVVCTTPPFRADRSPRRGSRRSRRCPGRANRSRVRTPCSGKRVVTPLSRIPGDGDGCGT